MATRTVSRTGQTGKTESDGIGQKAAEQQPPRPAIWLQVVLQSGASQPVGIALDAPDWEQALDNTVTQIKLLVMRDQVQALRRQPG